MKDGWKNNLGLKIGAFVFAVFLWWTVVNIDDPIQGNRYSADVTLTNTEVVTNAGKSYQIIGNTKTVSVTVKARRKVLQDIKSSDIVATADFREIDEHTQLVPIRVSVKGFEGEYVEASANPRNLQVKTEVTETKVFPISVATIGDVREGYILDKVNTVASPKSIEISGPKSSLGRINRVVAKVDVSELSRDKTLKAEVIYYDSADNIVDASVLSSNCDKKGVSVDVKLLITQNLTLDFDTSAIETAEGYAFGSIEIEPRTVKVAGKKSELKGMVYLPISSEALKTKPLKKSKKVVVDVAQYLPENLSLADETAGSVVVNILVEKAGVKSLVLPVRSVKVNNVLEEFEIAYESEQNVELQFSGPKQVLENLVAENILAVIDLSEHQEEGTYIVPIQVIDLPEKCEYVGKSEIEITLKRKEQ